jgi:Cu-Zn family superoxide dismutase
MPDQLFARAIHGADPRAAGKNECPVDIEEDEFAHRFVEAIYNRRSGGSLNMKLWNFSTAIAAALISGAVAAAQTPAPAPPAPAAQPAPAAKPGAPARAHADIKGEGISGTAEFAERATGTGKIVDITVSVTGLKPGMHGVHLHAVGKCEPDFTAAGGHFDPGPAGNMDPDANHPFHMGDIPNLDAPARGRATMKISTSRVTLSDGPLSLFDADGSAIIIHGNPDQGITGAAKSGVSGGPRVACGVISK